MVNAADENDIDTDDDTDSGQTATTTTRHRRIYGMASTERINKKSLFLLYHKLKIKVSSKIVRLPQIIALLVFTDLQDIDAAKKKDQ